MFILGQLSIIVLERLHIFVAGDFDYFMRLNACISERPDAGLSNGMICLLPCDSLQGTHSLDKFAQTVDSHW